LRKETAIGAAFNLTIKGCSETEIKWFSDNEMQKEEKGFF